jgi:hypothetical protein
VQRHRSSRRTAAQGCLPPAHTSSSVFVPSGIWLSSHYTHPQLSERPDHLARSLTELFVATIVHPAPALFGTPSGVFPPFGGRWSYISVLSKLCTIKQFKNKFTVPRQTENKCFHPRAPVKRRV